MVDRLAPDVRANALSAAGQMRIEQGDVAIARELLQEAVALQRELGFDARRFHAQRGVCGAHRLKCAPR